MRMTANEIHFALLRKISQFAKDVAPMYAKLEHRWIGRLDGEVPTASDIEDCAASLISMLTRNGVEAMHNSASTGGIEVSYTHYGDSTDCHIKYVAHRITA